MHDLDRPAWAALTSYHARLAVGGELARRFLPEVNVFASAREDSPQALAALTDLIRPGETVYVLQVPPIVIPPGMVPVRETRGVQMLAPAGTPFHPPDQSMIPLTDADAPEMLALATLTQPGPFLPRTHVMGSFLGIRLDGRLAAMAGERMRFAGFTEVSAVCTHPDYRGRGLARGLSAAVAHRIQQRGDQAFLHAWQTNHAAIALYASLGFELRAHVHVAELRRH